MIHVISPAKSLLEIRYWFPCLPQVSSSSVRHFLLSFRLPVHIIISFWSNTFTKINKTNGIHAIHSLKLLEIIDNKRFSFVYFWFSAANLCWTCSDDSFLNDFRLFQPICLNECDLCDVEMVNWNKLTNACKFSSFLFDSIR